MENVKTICELNMGSRLYHLDTPTSDFDKRSLFINLDADYILGTRRFDEARKQNSVLKLDVVAKEISHWVRMLHQANTEALEMLFAPRSEFTIYEPEFDSFRQSATEFLDSKKLFNALRGYMVSEHALATGRRTGKLGSSRADALAKYKYSPKNVVQILRLSEVGCVFFKTGKFVVDCREFDDRFYKLLYRIKTNPSSYSLAEFEQDYVNAESHLVSSFEARKNTYYFNEQLANRLLLKSYFPPLHSQYQSLGA